MAINDQLQYLAQCCGLVWIHTLPDKRWDDSDVCSLQPVSCNYGVSPTVVWIGSRAPVWEFLGPSSEGERIYSSSPLPPQPVSSVA